MKKYLCYWLIASFLFTIGYLIGNELGYKSGEIDGLTLGGELAWASCNKQYKKLIEENAR